MFEDFKMGLAFSLDNQLPNQAIHVAFGVVFVDYVGVTRDEMTALLILRRKRFGSSVEWRPGQCGGRV